MAGGHLAMLKARRIRGSLLGPPPDRHSVDHPSSHGILQPPTQSDCRPRQARCRCFLTFVRRRVQLGAARHEGHRASPTCRLAENCGLTVEQEATDGGRDRRSDLVISGGGVRVAWEVPLSPSTPVIYTSGSTWHSVTAGAAIDVSPTSLGATGQTRTRDSYQGRVRIRDSAKRRPENPQRNQAHQARMLLGDRRAGLAFTEIATQRRRRPSGCTRVSSGIERRF